MEKVKRERSVNFSITERDILVSLVQKYHSILENKESNITAWKKKEAAWKRIQKEFNDRSGGIYRTLKTLKIKYEGLKRAVRKKTAALRSELYRTGGINTVQPLDTAEENIKTILSLNTNGLKGVYDCEVLPNENLVPTFSEDATVEAYNLPNQVLKVELEEAPHTKSELDALSRTSEETFTKDYTVNDLALHDTPSNTPISSRNWDDTSRHSFKSTKQPTFSVDLSNKSLIADFNQSKLEIIQLQKEILESELIEKKKEWEYKELQRQREKEFEEKERKWKEEEYKLKNNLLLQQVELKKKEDSRKEDEHKLRMEKLRKELSES